MITEAKLNELGECMDGVEWFCERYPDGLDLIKWTREEQIDALKNGGAPWLGWGFEHGLIPFWNLNGANLNGANLYGANLYGANLDGASLNRANLDGASLYGARIPSLYKDKINEDDVYGYKSIIWV